MSDKKPVEKKKEAHYSLLDFEKRRYEEKGFGFLVAVTIAFVYFYYGPQFGRYIWPKFLSLIK